MTFRGGEERIKRIEVRIQRQEDRMDKVQQEQFPQVWVQLGQLKVKVGFIVAIAGSLGGVIGGVLVAVITRAL